MTIEEAQMMVEFNSTIREVASLFGMSRCAIHRDLTRLLPELDEELHDKCRKILATNKEEALVRMQAAKRRTR